MTGRGPDRHPRVRRPEATLAERLERKLAPPNRQGCRLWTGATNGQSGGGYGQIRVAGRGSALIGAHVAAFILGGGTIPPGYKVDHQCHNRDESCAQPTPCPHRLCCTFDHLRAVTNRENILAGRPVGGAGIKRRKGAAL